MFYVSNLYFIFIFYIHYTLTCKSNFALLLIKVVDKNLIPQIDQKNCDEISISSQFYIS